MSLNRALKYYFLVGRDYYFIIILLLYDARLEAICNRFEDVAENRNTWDHLLWNAANEDLMYEVCIPHRIPHAWE